MTLDLLSWTLALSAAFVIGLSKSGIKGISILSVTLMAITFGGKASTGLLLPLLIVGDVFAVIYYNRHTQWQYLRKLLPWMVIGVLLGVWLGKDLPEALFKRGMAVIILGTLVMMIYWGRRKASYVPQSPWFSALMGLGAGFTTMIGNLAGAFSSLYFLSMRLPKNEFIGTAAWLFFIINIFKLPFHIFVWKTITQESLMLNAYLSIGIIAGLIVGIQLVKLIREELYRHLVIFLTALGAVMIFFR